MININDFMQFVIRMMVSFIAAKWHLHHIFLVLYCIDPVYGMVITCRSGLSALDEKQTHMVMFTYRCFSPDVYVLAGAGTREILS